MTSAQGQGRSHSCRSSRGRVNLASALDYYLPDPTQRELETVDSGKDLDFSFRKKSQSRPTAPQKTA